MVNWRKLFERPAWSRHAKAALPQDAYFLLADRCNARCSMCQEDYFHSRSSKAIGLDAFKTISSNIKLRHMKTAVLAGGEPLLNRDFLEIVSFLNQSHPRTSVVVVTNGIALRGDLADELAQRRIHSVNVSVNAATPRTYSILAQVDCFNRVIENIRHFQELHARAGRPSALTLSFVAHRKNIEELPQFVQLAHSLGVTNVAASYCRFFPMAIRLRLAASADAFLSDDDSLYFHRRMSDEIFGEADALARRLGVNLTREPLFSEKVAPENCRFPFAGIMVGFDGEVFPCCGGEVIFKEKVHSGAYDFGNALNSAIESFWHNECYRALRYSVLHPDRPAVPECAACTHMLKWKGHVKNAHIMDWDSLAARSVDFPRQMTGDDES